MSLNETVSAERIHISFFGKRNVGKSSLVNAVTGQNLSIVSDVKGTTTDPVKKAMELLPLGPVLITDTPGLDDEGTLGAQRIKKAKQTLAGTDIAVLVTDAVSGLSDEDLALIDLFSARGLPYLIAYNKTDLLPDVPQADQNAVYVSALTGLGVTELKRKLGDFAKQIKTDKKLLADLVSPGDTVVLVIPIDLSAPKGRIILPQQQVLRELLDLGCTAVCCQPGQLPGVLAGLRTPPRLVVTDSQVFARVAQTVPKEIPLTSFSILFARYKGELQTLVAGAKRLSSLRDGERVLISEGCTHHRQCGDIGTEKLPRWIEAYSGAKPVFSFTSGGDFPEVTSDYALIVHCGGCMLGEAEMRARMARAEISGVPMVNYGVAIAAMHGLLDRSLSVFGRTDEM
ncbi:MAG: [Clostridia bacterium]|nr:[FeFe] hydrogenase H-cluster maturation GTPase HydF [Clostridia bacterium]